MTPFPTSLLAFALPLALGACADLGWEKKGSDETVASRDFYECQRSAEYQGFQMGMNPAGSAPTVVVGPGGPSVTFQGPGASSQQHSLLVQSLTRECMEKKGYNLIRRP